MASKTYLQHYADGSEKWFTRKKQGRKPSGLGILKKYRLYAEDEIKLMELKQSLGNYYNENEIIRNAVHLYLNNYVGTESVIQ
jgi:hypothetical protein